MKNTITLLLAAIALCSSTLTGRAAQSNDSGVATDPGWPRQQTNAAGHLVYYQPQIDNWKDFKELDFRMAFAFTPKQKKRRSSALS